MRPTFALVVPTLACLALAGCSGWSRSDDAASKKKPQTIGAIPIGAATAETDAQQAAKDRRAQASAVSIDTSVPPLPEDVGLRTTDVELGTAALLVAQSEKDAGALGDGAVADRHAQIYATWRPQMLARQALLRQIADERKRESDRQIAEAGRIAKHDAELHATEARLKKEVEAERRKHVAILSRQDREILE